MRSRLRDFVRVALPIAGITAAAWLLAAGEDHSSPEGAVYRTIGTIVLGLVCIQQGYVVGVLNGRARSLRQQTEMFQRSQEETLVLVAAIKLAGGLGRADMATGALLTSDERDLIEAVAALALATRRGTS